MRAFIKKLLARVLGKSGQPVVAVFLSGDEALGRAMAAQMREIVADYPHVVVIPEGMDRSAYTYAEEVIVVRPERPLECWREVRRRLARRWIALAPFVWEGGGPLRWMPWVLAPRKLLAFNANLERHHLRLRHPIASWRFLRGERVGDIFRPTALAGLGKIAAVAGFPLVMACWAVVWARGKRAQALVARQASEPGVAVVEAGAWERIDEAVAEARFDRVLVGDEKFVAVLSEALEDPRVWLAYVGRKAALQGGVAAESEAKIGERGTWALAGRAAAAMFQRDVYLELGGAARLEREYPGATLAALSLLGWQRGYRTVFAGEAEAAGAALTDAERLMLGTLGDFRTAAELLWRWAAEPRRWRAGLRALGARGTPAPAGRTDAEFLQLADASVHVFRGRRTGSARRVAVVSPYLPYPLSHGGAIRIFNLLRRAAEDAEISLFAFAERETGREVAPLLEFCARVVLVDTPRWETPGLLRVLPRGVSKFRSRAMRAALATVAREERIPIVQAEYTQLAWLREAAREAGAKSILVEHDVTFDLHRQLRQRARGGGKLGAWMEETRWRRYELGEAREFDRVIAMSQEDAERLAGEGVARERLRVVENGVDLERFAAAGPAEAAPGEVLFIGSFRHFPNVMGFRFLVEEVWPAVSRWNPAVKLTVVAGAEHRYYWKLHTGGEMPELPPQIEVLDFVEDVRPLYRRAAVVAVPLVVSAGTNIKVLEALAMRRAVVSTNVGVAGLGLAPGENVIIAESADAFAAAVLGLLASEETRERIASNGRALVEARYDWGVLAKKMVAVWEELGQPETMVVSGGPR